MLHFYSGSPIKIFTSKDGVDYETIELGSNNLSHNINKNTWFAMKSTGAYSLIGCTVAPAFIFDDLEMAPNGWKPTNFDKNF